jgi:hypothetical protein
VIFAALPDVDEVPGLQENPHLEAKGRMGRFFSSRAAQKRPARALKAYASYRPPVCLENSDSVILVMKAANKRP